MSSAAEPHRSGRLRLKKSKEDRYAQYRESVEHDREGRRHQRKKRGRRRGGQDDTGFNAASGPSRHPTALFGDDLLRAERYEAAKKESKDWSAKLGELLQDDVRGGFGEYGAGVSSAFGAGGDEDGAWEEEMMRLRGEEFSGENPQEIPKRWRDAAQGFQSNMGLATAGLKEMDEEEYAEYIRDGMYRRKHAKEIAFEEERQRAWEEAQEKKRKAREEKRLAKKRRREEEEKEQSEQRLKLSRLEWEATWSKLMASDVQPCCTFHELPWPVLSDAKMTKESVHHFLFHDSEKQEGSKRLRTALLRYHPDRFLSSRHFANLTSKEDQERAREAVEKVAKILSDIVNERRAS